MQSKSREKTSREKNKQNITERGIIQRKYTSNKKYEARELNI